MSQFDQPLVRHYIIMRSAAVFIPDISVSAREGNSNGHLCTCTHTSTAAVTTINFDKPQHRAVKVVS